MKSRLPLLLICCLFTFSGCTKRESESSAIFNYNNSISSAQAENFLQAFQTLLKENNFHTIAPPATWLSGGGTHLSGSPEIWMEGSYHGSLHFYLKYIVQQSSGGTYLLVESLWNIEGSESDILATKAGISELATDLKNLGFKYGNEIPNGGITSR